MKRAHPWWPADLELCRICGWSFGEPEWAAPGSSPKYVICDCCGAETGVADTTEASARTYRERWLARGADGAIPAADAVAEVVRSGDGQPTRSRITDAISAMSCRSPAADRASISA